MRVHSYWTALCSVRGTSYWGCTGIGLHHVLYMWPEAPLPDCTTFCRWGCVAGNDRLFGFCVSSIVVVWSVLVGSLVCVRVEGRVWSVKCVAAVLCISRLTFRQERVKAEVRLPAGIYGCC